MRLPLAFAAVLLLPTPLWAGLYYSAETFAELPSRWRGFLLDQRLLRTAAIKPSDRRPASPVRKRYQQEAARLASLARTRKLTADESADLGALHVRLGDPGRALEVLQPAQRAHPAHFRLAANLGTAWHLHGDLTQASSYLEQAVRLAPGTLQKVEKLHLDLVRRRSRERAGVQTLDDLFGVRFVGPGGKYEAGRLDAAQSKRLPANAVALVQQLALTLPADGRLLWQLAELANAHGDVSMSAAMMDGCVIEFGLRSPELQAHRRLVRAAAEELARKGKPAGSEEHKGHALTFKPRSSRPLVSTGGRVARPPITLKGVNPLPWEVLAETRLDRRSQPTFTRYLKELDGKKVKLSGFLQPLGEDADLSSFLLIEHPVGCWYCEMPDMVSIVLVEMPTGKTGRMTRDMIHVTGELVLNATDPENFLYTIRNATVSDKE
jgi:hypothetical protein